MRGGTNAMNIQIVYDSKYGNTKEIAEAIKRGFGDTSDIQLLRPEDIDINSIGRPAILIVGSPTQAWNPTKNIKSFLKDIAPDALSGVAAAAFDTAFRSRLSGSAAKSIARTLRQKGCHIIDEPASFIVLKSEGPLQEGESARATAWAQKLRKLLEKDHA
jgi:flavodoxin